MGPTLTLARYSSLFLLVLIPWDEELKNSYMEGADVNTAILPSKGRKITWVSPETDLINGLGAEYISHHRNSELYST